MFGLVLEYSNGRVALPHSTICKTCFELVNCRLIGSQLRLYRAGDVQCYAKNTWQWQALVLAGLGLCVLPFPALLNVFLRRGRDQPHGPLNPPPPPSGSSQFRSTCFSLSQLLGACEHDVNRLVRVNGT